MKIEKPIEGYFHVDEIQKSTTPGKLEFSVKNGIKLNLMGAFRRDDFDRSNEKRWDVIHGYSMNGEFITLINSRGHESERLPGIPSSRYQAESMLLGSKYFEPQGSSVKKISFRVSNLDLWLNRTGLKYETSREVHGAFTASYEHPGFIKLHTNDRFELGVWHSTSIPMFRSDNVLGDVSEKAYLNLKYTGLATLKEAMDDILMIRDFMSLAMATPIVVEDAVLYLDGSKEDHTRRFDLYFPLGNDYPVRKETERRYMIYPFDDIEPFIDTSLAAWVELYPRIKHGISFYHEAYFSTTRHAYQKFLDYTFSYESIHRALSSMTIYPESEFADLRAGVLEQADSRYRGFLEGVLRFANEASLRQRLKKSFAAYGLNELLGKVAKSDIDKLVETRNSMVHTTTYNTEGTIQEDEILDYNTLVRLLIAAELFSAIGALQSDPLERLRRHTSFNFMLEAKTQAAAR